MWFFLGKTYIKYDFMLIFKQNPFRVGNSWLPPGCHSFFVQCLPCQSRLSGIHLFWIPVTLQPAFIVLSTFAFVFDASCFPLLIPPFPSKASCLFIFLFVFSLSIAVFGPYSGFYDGHFTVWKITLLKLGRVGPHPVIKGIFFPLILYTIPR